MNIKKLLAVLMAVVMVLGLAACGGGDTDGAQAQTTGTTNGDAGNATPEDGTPTSVTISTVYGDVEVPYAPQRVCALDFTMLDFIHTLGLGEVITCVQSSKNTPTYLAEYYDSDAVIVLQRGKNKGGNKDGQTTETTEETDPYELYYSIDADLIVGSVDTVDEAMYEVLSQIAPTVVLDYASADPDGIYAGVKANARTIASIWGVEDTLDDLVAEYDAVYAELKEDLQGISIVVLSTAVDASRIQVESGDDDSVLLFQELGMVVLSNDAPEEVVTASVYDRNADEATQAAKNQVIAAWIEEADPAYILLADRTFDDIEAARDEGYSCAELDGLTAYQEGRACQLSNGAMNGANGLMGTFTQMDRLKAFFLG